MIDLSVRRSSIEKDSLPHVNEEAYQRLLRMGAALELL
jgi:hypothetical protein